MACPAPKHLDESTKLIDFHIRSYASSNSINFTQIFKCCISLSIYSSNDAPHGLFVVGSAMVIASGQGSSITRQLNFTVSRQFGDQGTVEVTISMYYNQVAKSHHVLLFIYIIIKLHHLDS